MEIMCVFDGHWVEMGCRDGEKMVEAKQKNKGGKEKRRKKRGKGRTWTAHH